MRISLSGNKESLLTGEIGKILIILDTCIVIPLNLSIDIELNLFETEHRLCNTNNFSSPDMRSCEIIFKS
jgi:hypothetical protein